MMDAALPFALCPEARNHLIDDLNSHAMESRKAKTKIRSLPSLPALIWSYGSKVDGVDIGPEIAIGYYDEPPKCAGSLVLIGAHSVWIGEPTMNLLRGRSLIFEQRCIPGLTNSINCYWVDPEPDEVCRGIPKPRTPYATKAEVHPFIKTTDIS